MRESVQTDATFPERIYELAREHRIGAPVKAYRSSRSWWLVFLVIPLLVFLLADINSYVIQVTNSQQTVQYLKHCQICTQTDKNALNQFHTSLLSQVGTEMRLDIIGLVVMSLAIIALLFYFRQGSPLYRCEKGFLLEGVKKSIITFHWDEITEVYWKGEYVYCLCKDENVQNLVLTEFRKNQDIGEYVEREVTPRLLAHAIARYKEYGRVSFGHIAIDQEGLIMNRPAASLKSDSLVCWGDLEDIRFTDGMLTIKLQSEWKGWGGHSPAAQKQLARTIPNPTVYVALTKYLLENARIEEKRIGE